MDRQVIVNKTSDIPAAVELAKQYAACMPEDSEKLLCPLLCEELLLRLLNMGCTGIKVSLKSFPVRCVEIRAEGERADAFQTFPEKEEDRLDFQINGCLLDQYADSFTFRYRRGVNLYRLYAGKTASMDLTGEIFDFYQSADQRAQLKPTEALCYLAHRHKGFSYSRFSSFS